jgi:hypothetical protein
MSQTQHLSMQVLVIFIHATLMQTISTSSCNMSYSFAAAALNPRTYYDYGTAVSVMQDLREAFEYMADTDTCVTALQEVKHFRRKLGTFSTKLAQKMAYDKNTSPDMLLILPLHSSLLFDEGFSFFCLLHLSAQWCAMFGGDTPFLQGLALRLVSQCCSFNECERNWTTFALIHTKVRIRLSYKKLHKLVYVNYNFRIRLRQASLYKREEDLFDKLIELSLYDAQNPIQDWMDHGRSNEDPLLDEEDTHSDNPILSRLVTEGGDSRTLQRITGKSSLANWADETVGDTHIGKCKHKTITKQGKGKSAW